MKKINKISVALLFALLTFSYISCKYDLVDPPTRDENSIKNAADYADSILPPETVSATQGGYRNINLSWSSVANAVQYQIFAATTPFDSFTQIAETTGTETSIDIEEEPGITAYYSISAVNYYGTVSAKSKIVQGSTLSIPVITDISSNESGDALTVTWWMDNCSQETYEDSLQFVLTAYDTSKTEITDGSIIVTGENRSGTIENLIPKTDYYFVVEAQVLNEDGTLSDQKSEKSDYTNASTTHNVTPPCAKEVQATQGISTSEILLSWTLPQGADYYDSKSSSYIIHPVFFEVQRKKTTDTDFSTIKRIGVSDIPSVKTGTSGDKEVRNSSEPIELTFDCEEGKTYTSSGADASDILTISGNGTALEEYPKYIPETILTFHDKDLILERGVKYTYRIISYTDDTTKKIVADSSTSEDASGWKIDYANFVTSKEYTLKTGSNNEISNFKISFSTDFDAMGISYKYILKEKVIVEGNLDGAYSEIKNFTSVSALKEYIRTIDTATQALGKYEYMLEIKDSENTLLISQKSIGSIKIVDDVENLSVLEYVEIEDGYSTIFRVFWNYNDNYTYKIKKYLYETYNSDTAIGEPVTYDIGTDYQLDNSNAYYDIPAQPDEIAKFEIFAYRNSIEDSNIGNDNKFQTLGKAKIIHSVPDYKDITVTWPSVPKATGYSVSAVYEDNTTVELTNDINSTLEESTPGIWTFKLSEPDGYNDASKSGKPIALKVTAINEEKNDFTVSEKTVRNLGPQAVNTRISGQTDKNINISWDKIDGVAGYILYSIPYEDGAAQKLSDYTNDISYCYFIDSTGNLTKPEHSTSTLSITETGFTLNDKYDYLPVDTPDNEKNQYRTNQNKLSYGLPFAYYVIPVMSQNNPGSEVSFEVTDNIITAKAKDITYSNAANALTLGATLGYGLKVTASKAISNSKIEITWEQPYDAANKIPKVYKRTVNSTDWHHLTDLRPSNSKTLSYTDNLTLTDGIYAEEKICNDINAYEYAVFYSQENCTDSYIDYLNSNMDALSLSETQNKGYALTLQNGISATFEEDYKERFNWTGCTYNFNQRKVGPDYYEIQILNKNNNRDWISVARINIDTQSNNFGDIAVSNDSYINDTKVTLTSSTSKSAILSAVMDSDLFSNGQLQVLRDYKHYYRLLAVRELNGDYIYGYADKSNSDTSVYASRKITENEFVKIGMLQYANAIYSMCNEDHVWNESNTNTTTEKYGEWKILKDWGLIYYKIKDYNLEQLTPYLERILLPVKLTTTDGDHKKDECIATLYANTKTGFPNDQSKYTCKINEVTLTLTPINSLPDEIKESYSGTITFSSTGNQNITLTSSKFASGTTITAETKENRLKYLPIRMNGDDIWYHTGDNGKAYGWWN